jgi:trehalose synthase
MTYPDVTAADYWPLLSPQLVEELTDLAHRVKGMRFVHVNSAAVGGGVAEVLQSLVPLMTSLGVETERVVINPTYPPFFQVTKKLHNLLQGADGKLSREELDLYLRTIQEVSNDIQDRDLQADVWFLHDPQLLPLAQMLPRRTGETRLWVCHVDLTSPNPGVMDQLMPLTAAYDGLMFSLDSYVPPGLNYGTPVYIVPPAIDPLTSKNSPMPAAEAAAVIGAMGIDPARPLVTQVSRFDFWKDPWGVIDAYRLARKEAPGLQLALLGISQAADDPEALDVVNRVAEHAANDPDIHLYFCPDNLPDTIDRIVNAFQSASEVVLQKSIREGFGLTVAETMWKGRPLIGGNVGGIRLQIEDGVSGFLVDSPAECAQCIVELVRSQALRQRIGQAARESVRQKYLLPRLALEYLEAARPHISDASLAAAMVRNGQYHGFADLDVLPEA